MKRVILSLTVMVMVCFATYAQRGLQDVIYLKNGSVIKGVIIEQVPLESLKIETKDGSTFFYSMSEIEKITKESQNRRSGRMSDSPLYRNSIPGYRGMVEFGGNIGVGDFGGGSVELSTSHGYQLNPFLFVGAGISVNYDAHYTTCFLPVFAHIKGKLTDGPIAPFLSLKIGYSIAEDKGFYINPNIGISIDVREKNAVTFTVGYTSQTAEFYYWGNKGIGGITLKAGYEF